MNNIFGIEVLSSNYLEISSKNQNFFLRGMATGKWFFFAFLLIEIIYSIRYGYNSTVVIWLAVLAFFFIGYSFFKNIDVLYKCSYDSVTQQVEVLIFHYSFIKKYTCKKDDFKLEIKQDFSSKYKTYIIVVYVAGEHIITQRQSGAWTYSKMKKVAEGSKSFTSRIARHVGT